MAGIYAEQSPPVTFVVFGATGDLSTRKLLPALFDLYAKHMLPNAFHIVGFSRKEHNDIAFQNIAREAVLAARPARDAGILEKFLTHLSYRQGVFDEATAYGHLAEFLIETDEREHGGCSHKLFYLATPPALYEMILKNLAESGLTIPCGGTQGWTRVLIEKPFGSDLETAQALDRLLGLLFKEEQVFRIDHYLAKETVQNVLAFRFSNILFEPLWNNRFIEKVEIRLWEQAGVEGRGSFYDSVGALRDVGQNHMLQMLSLVAMEDPKELDAALIRKERARVLSALRPIGVDTFGEYIARGQYQGYREVEGVAPDSQTETSVHVTAFVENERWRGVPFILEAGKKMSETKTEIVVYFKRTETCLCPPGTEHHHQNTLTFRIQPNEGIRVVFWAKKPGFATTLEPQELSFSYAHSAEVVKLPDAYERVLYDCVRGDQTLFASTAEVEAAWQFITPILQHWQSVPLENY